jgi:hypothetical protein
LRPGGNDTAAVPLSLRQAADLPAAIALTISVVRAFPPIPHDPLFTSSIVTQVTPRIFSPSIETIASVNFSMISFFCLVAVDNYGRRPITMEERGSLRKSTETSGRFLKTQNSVQRSLGRFLQISVNFFHARSSRYFEHPVGQGRIKKQHPNRHAVKLSPAVRGR